MTTTQTSSTTTQHGRVTIVGPNLPSELSDKATFHVHQAGCAHLKRGALGRAKAADQGGWTIQVNSRYEIEADVYDFAPAECEGYVLGDYQGEFHFGPCLDYLPEQAPKAPAPEAPAPEAPALEAPALAEPTMNADGFWS
jgi:hypothetical protein